MQHHMDTDTHAASHGHRHTYRKWKMGTIYRLCCKVHTGAQIHTYFLINVLISERNVKVTLLGTVKRGIRPSSCTSLLLSSEDSCIHTYGNEINFKFNLKFTPTLSLVYTYSMFNCNTHSYLCTYGSACATTMGSDVRCVLTCSYLPPCTE